MAQPRAIENGSMARRNSPPTEGPDHPNLLPDRPDAGAKRDRALVVSNTVAGGNGSTALRAGASTRQLMPGGPGRGGGAGTAARKGGGGGSGPQAEVLRLMADHVAEHKRRLEKVEKFNDSMVPTRGWKWYHTFMLLLYTVTVAALATTIGGLFVSSLYGASPAEGFDGIALGGGVSGTEPAVLVIADAESSHVHVRASAEHSATLLVGDDDGMLLGGDCAHMQVLDRDEFTPASICSSNGVLTLTGAGGGYTSGDATGRRLQDGLDEGGAEGQVRQGGWGGGWPTSGELGGLVGSQKRVLQGSPTKPALRVDGLVEIAAGLTVLAEPLEVTGMMRVEPAQRNMDVGSSDRNLPPATFNVYGAMFSNRLTVDGSTFLKGPLQLTRGNLEVEQMGTFGRMNVDGSTTLRGGTTIGDGEPNQDRLNVLAETVVTGVTNLRSDVIIGVERESRRALQADEPEPEPGPTISIYSDSTFHNNVSVVSDISVGGDFMSPVFNTQTGRKQVQLPPIPPPWTPDFLYFPCGWDEPVTICMNASVYLAPGPFNFTNLTESVLDIGTDPLCEDDLNGTLASLGYTCETAVEVVDCDFDMSTNAPQLESGTYVRDLCPVSCINCPCRLPWCVDPEEQARRAAEALLGHVNVTVNETRVKELLYISLANELGALHGIEASRIRILDFQNNSLTDVKLDYRIVPDPYDTGAETPTDLLAELRMRNTSEFELMVCASSLIHNGTNGTNATTINGTAINGTVIEMNATNATLPQLDALLNSSLLNITNQTTMVQWMNTSNLTLANFSEPSNCTVAVPYEVIYPPPPPPPDIFEWRTVTDVYLTGDTTFTESLTATAEVTLGGPPDMPCRKDGIDYQCVVDIVAPAELAMSLTVAGHTDVTSATAEEIDTGLINWGSGTAGSLIIGGTISDIPIYYAHQPLMTVGGAMFLGSVRMGARASNRHSITGDVTLSGKLTSQGNVVLGVQGVGYTTDIYSATRIYNSLSVSGAINLADTTCQTLVVRGFTLVQGPSELQNDVVLNSNSQNTLTVKGEASFQQPVSLREDLSVTGNTVLGANSENNVIAFAHTKLMGGLNVVGDVNLGSEPAEFDYFYLPPPSPPPELVVEYGFRTCGAEIAGTGYDCARCDMTTNAWQVLDVVLASCTTAVNPECAAQTNQLLCENNVADSACTWTGAVGDVPAACSTTGIPECAAADVQSDVAACTGAGACTFTPATSSTDVVVSLSGCFDAAVVPMPATCTGNSTYIPDSCDATDPSADQATRESCEAADNVLDCFLLGAATCTFTPWSQPNCEVGFALADDNLAHSCPLGCDFVAEVTAPLPDITYVPDRVTVSVPTNGMGLVAYTADVWLNDKGSCVETAATSVPEDQLACDSVAALADSTACDLVMLNADGTTPACTYSTVLAQPSSISVDLATMPGFRVRDRALYGFITDATYVPPPPPKEQKVHVKTTLTQDLNVYGSTFMQNLSATNVYFPLGARIGTPGGAQEKVELFADTTVIGTFLVDNDVDLAANGNSQVTVGSNTQVNADFTATGAVDLGVSTLDQAHVEGSAQIDGSSVLNGHVTLGDDVFDLTTVKSRTLCEQDVHFTGADFTVDHSTQIGSTQDDELLVNASAKLYSGLELHGQVDMYPLSTCTAHVPGTGLVPFACEQPADGDTECPSNVDYCLFTLGGTCGAPFASMHLTEEDCTGAGGTWTWDTQGSCALSDQAACDTAIDAYDQPTDDDGGAACLALKCVFWSSDVVIRPPTRLTSSLAVGGDVTLGTAELTDDWGVTITAATETAVMGTATMHDTLTLKDVTVAESDITVIDGACRYNCIQEVKIDAQHGGLSATGDVVVGGILNPDTVLTVGSQMRVNIIQEHASNTGVTVEGITFIDGGFERATTDTLTEFTLNHGVDIEGILLRDGVVMLESQLPGMSSKGELDMLTLTNSGNSDDMDGTLSSILFRQFYYDPSIIPSSDPAMDAVNAKESGKLVVGTESDWTQVMTTRDSFLSMHVAEDGIVYERVRVNSNGDVTLPGTDGTSNIVLGAETGDIQSTGNINLIGADAGQTGIFFQDKFGFDLTDDGVLKISSDQDNGEMLWDMGVTGVVDVVAKKVSFDLEEEFHLRSDIRISGVARFNDDPESFSLQQSSTDLFLVSGGTCSDAAQLRKADCDGVGGTWTVTGALHADVRSSVFYGDVVLQSDPTDFSASLGLSNGAEAFQLTKDITTGELKWQFAADVTVATPTYNDLAVMDSTGTFTLATGSFVVGDVFDVDVAAVETTARGQINLKSVDAVNTATVLLNSATIPELIVSTDANVGTIILNPGDTSGFFQVRDVFTVQGSDGTTEIAGNVQVGGLSAPGAASVVTINSGNAVEKSELVLSDGTDSFSITKLNRNSKPYLSIASSKVNGVIDIAPGATTGELRVNYDRLVLQADTGDVAMRGSLTVGGVASGYCATDIIEARTMDCIFPFTYNGVAHSSCDILDGDGVELYCATKVDETGESTSLGSACQVCAEGARQLEVTSNDDAAGITVQGISGGNPYGQLQLGSYHTLTSNLHTLAIDAVTNTGSVEIAPGSAGALKVFGDKFRISGPDADVVGHGAWSVGELTENGAASLSVISPDAAATVAVNAAAAGQAATAIFSSADTHTLSISQTDGSAAVAGTGSVELSSTGGMLISSDTGVSSALIFDASASASGGALATTTSKATMDMAGGDFQLAVQSGDILLSGANLAMSVDKFTIDGSSGDTFVAGLLTVGLTGSVAGSASSVMDFSTSENTFTFTTVNDLVVTSSQDDAHFWIKPGTASGQFKVGDNFLVAGASGNTEISGELTVGVSTGDHVMTDLSVADTSILAIGAASDGGTSTLRMGKTGSSTFEITQTDALMTIASTDNAGTLQISASAVGVAIPTGNSFAVNTNQFTLIDGAGTFSGDVSIGIPAITGARQLQVSSAADDATVRVASAAGSDAKLLLTTADSSTAGSQMVQNGAALALTALDSDGTITLAPGSDAAAALYVTSDTKVEEGTNKIHLGVSSAVAGAVATLSDATGSESTITQLSDTLTLRSVDGTAGTVNVEAGSAVRVNTDDLVVLSTTKEVQTAGDVTVGATAAATGAGTRRLTVTSADDEVALLLKPEDVNQDASLVFGSNAVDTWTVAKVGTVLRASAGGTSTDIDFVPDGVLSIGGTSTFSVTAATGNLATAGDATIGCATCTGERRLTVASQDEHVYLDLTPDSTSKDVAISFGSAGNRFELRQTSHTLRLTAASADSTLELLPGASAGQTLTVGESVFVITVTTGDTALKGDLTLGGLQPSDTGARAITASSYDDDVTQTMTSGVGGTTSLILGERSSTDTFTLERVGTTLSLLSGATAGTLKLNPGTGGSMELGYQSDGTTPMLLLELATPLLTMRGDLTVGGASATGDRALIVSSSDAAVALTSEGVTGATFSLTSSGAGADTAVTYAAADEASLALRADGSGSSTMAVSSVGGAAGLSVTPGSLNSAGTLSLGTATEGIVMTALGTTVTLAHQHTSGVVEIDVGTTGGGKLDIADGLLTVNPVGTTGAGASTLGVVATSGDLEVAGSLTLESLALPTGTATGTTGIIINKPTGKVSHPSSSLGRISDETILTVPAETITLTNSLVTSDSVVIASVVAQCNVDTVVLVSKIETSAGQVVFTMSNAGIADCSNQVYTVSFAVLS